VLQQDVLLLLLLFCLSCLMGWAAVIDGKQSSTSCLKQEATSTPLTLSECSVFRAINMHKLKRKRLQHPSSRD
jgi:Tfp pilus assembly protein PilO